VLGIAFSFVYQLIPAQEQVTDLFSKIGKKGEMSPGLPRRRTRLAH
jgi:hypothetical protein